MYLVAWYGNHKVLFDLHYVFIFQIQNDKTKAVNVSFLDSM